MKNKLSKKELDNKINKINSAYLNDENEKMCRLLDDLNGDDFYEFTRGFLVSCGTNRSVLKTFLNDILTIYALHLRGNDDIQ